MAADRFDIANVMKDILPKGQTLRYLGKMSGVMLGWGIMLMQGVTYRE